MSARTAAGSGRSAGPLWGPGLALVLSVATVLRLLELGGQLWYDEITTLVEYVRRPAAEIATSYATLNNHVLYNLLARGSVVLLGESPAALRLPAALFGVAGVAALAGLGRRLASELEALCAALLLALSYHHVWFSQCARGYTALVACALVATSLFLDGLRGRRRSTWLAYGGVLAAALWFHLSGVFVAAAHALVLAVLAVVRRRRADRPGAAPWFGLALASGLTLLVYAPMLPGLVEAFGAKAGGSAAAFKVAAWTDPLWTAAEILRGLQAGAFSRLGIAAVGLLAAIGLASLARRRPVAVALLALPAPLTLAALLALEFHVWPRYFLVQLPLVALAVARGVFLLVGGLHRRRVAESPGGRAAPRSRAAVAAVAIAVLSGFTLPRLYRIPKQDWEGALTWVESRRLPGDRIATAGLAAFPYREYYGTGWTVVSSAAELDALAVGGRRVWLVHTFPRYLAAAAPDLASRLGRDLAEQARFPGTVGDGAIVVSRLD